MLSSTNSFLDARTAYRMGTMASDVRTFWRRLFSEWNRQGTKLGSLHSAERSKARIYSVPKTAQLSPKAQAIAAREDRSQSPANYPQGCSRERDCPTVISPPDGLTGMSILSQHPKKREAVNA